MSNFSHPHPNGVLPGGNAFMAGPSAAITRNCGLGLFQKFTDEQLAELLTYFDGITLGRISRVSKVFYVFSQLESLWRDLVLLHTQGSSISFVRSWKVTYASLISPNHIPAAISPPIKVKGFYSEYLFHQWLCCSYDIAKSIPGFYKHEDVPRIPAAELSVEQFIEFFEKPNKPVIITNGVSDWPAFSKWNKEYFLQVCGMNKFRASAASATLPATFTMEEYYQYAEQTQEESPLYLFDRNFVSIPELGADYRVPAYFSRPSTDNAATTAALQDGDHDHGDNHCTSSQPHQTDLFSLLGEQHRPDYHWLVMGPAKSGSLFHIDPNQTNAWNVCIEGRKKWIFYPPNHSPPGVESSEDGGDVIVPVSLSEWLLTFWPFHQEARYHANPAMRPLEVVTHPGDLIFVPHGYWHMVVNLDYCVALTHNYVSTSNLSAVLAFLRDKPDQISGLREQRQAMSPTSSSSSSSSTSVVVGCDDDGTDGHTVCPVAITRENLYSTFLQKITPLFPPSVLQSYIQASYSSFSSSNPIPKAPLATSARGADAQHANGNANTNSLLLQKKRRISKTSGMFSTSCLSKKQRQQKQLHHEQMLKINEALCTTPLPLPHSHPHEVVALSTKKAVIWPPHPHPDSFSRGSSHHPEKEKEDDEVDASTTPNNHSGGSFMFSFTLS